MNKSIITATLLLIVVFNATAQSSPTLVKEADINSRLLSRFQKHHQTQSVVTWWQDETNVQASFSEDQVHWTISYDRNSRCTRTIKRYRGEKLDENIRNLIAVSFPDSEISSVTELIVGSRQVHYINLVSRTKAKQVAVYNMELTVQQEFSLQ